ncbi:PDZ domain-containing protein [Cellulomonas fimi]|uniref:PDZ domain-containing protein n=1 Tax=Cellulomonas fimi TaxID=1708 RepID=A0A7Y0LW87_CELFI|nr:PDZ domain-containing protein [Cellulomonas fimi]
MGDDRRVRDASTGPGPHPDTGAPATSSTGSTGSTDPTDTPTLPVPPSPRSTTLSIAGLVTLVLLTLLVFVPVPYAIGSPGPTRDTLGAYDGEPLIEVDGVPTYESTGELRMTTVSYAGGPGYPVTLPLVLRGWLSGARVVTPVESVFPPDRSQDEIDQQNEAEMVSSQENATVAALEELGYEVPAELRVAGAVAGTGADGVVEEGDVLLSLEGEPVESYTELVRTLARTEPGTTVTLGLVRDGEPLDVDVVTGERAGGGSQLGVFIDPVFDLPVDVTIQIEDIGGPSAGMMFALGIIDTMTPEDELDGAVIAGTGTVDVDGKVGPIGGIRQKLFGAVRDGADWFLAPGANCDEVVGNVPDDLRVVRVETLGEARAAMEAIGAGAGDALPTCEAP